MKKILTLLILLSLTANCSALEPQIFGYFEPQLMSANLNGDWFTMNSNKLRLDIEAKPAKGVKFGANVNCFTYTGMTSYNLVDYIPWHLAQRIYPYERGEYTFIYADSIALDNVYLRMSWRLADLTVGKQQISYGTGYAWNPTDILNQKDQLDPTYEQTGHDAMRLDARITRNLNIMALYSPGKNWKYSTLMGRIKALLGGYDVSFTALTTLWNTTDFYASDPQDTYLNYLPVEETRNLLGFDIFGQLAGFGVWGEIGFNDMQYLDDFWEAIFGFDYTFRNGLYFLAEGYYNSEAPESSDEYTLTHWIRYLTGESKTLGQAQAYIYSHYPLTDLITIGGSVIGCVSDESAAVVPQVNYSLFQNVELTAFGNLFLGDEGTMYSKDMGNGGMLRLRVYF